MIIDVVRDKAFIREMREIYKDSWRFTLRVYKWMINRSLDYLSAKELIIAYDMHVPIPCPDKNALARSIVREEGFEDVEFLVDRKLPYEAFVYAEDQNLCLCKTLMKRGYGFYKDTLLYMEDDMLTCSQLGDRYYLDALLAVYFRPKEAIDFVLARKIARQYFVPKDESMLKDYMDCGPIDKTLKFRIASLLYNTNRYCFRLNEHRDHESLFFYEDDYKTITGFEANFAVITRITRAFSGFSGKYEKICKFFGIERFSTGLVGGGSFSLTSSNNFYEDYFVRGIVRDSAILHYNIFVNSMPVEFDPMGFFLESEYKRVGQFEVNFGFSFDLMLSIPNPMGYFHSLLLETSSGNSFKIEIGSEDKVLKWCVMGLTITRVEDGKLISPFIRLSSLTEVEVNLRLIYKKWRGIEQSRFICSVYE